MFKTELYVSYKVCLLVENIPNVIKIIVSLRLEDYSESENNSLGGKYLWDKIKTQN